MGLVLVICSFAFAGCLHSSAERQDADEPEGEFPVEIVSAEFPAKQRLAQTSELRLSVANVGDETIPDLAITVFTDADTEVEVEEDTGGTEGETSGGTATDAEGEEIPKEQLGEAVDEALREELENAEGATTPDEDSTEEETTEEDSGTTEEEEGPQAEGAFSVLSQQPGLAIPSRPVWILEHGYPREATAEPGPSPAGEVGGSGGAEAAQTNTFSFGSLDPNETTELVWLVTPVQAGTFTVHYRIAAGLQGKAIAVNEDGSEPQGEFVVRISDVPPQTRVDDSGKVVPIKKGDIIGQAGTQEQKGELGE
jgi:hypothetical protein